MKFDSCQPTSCLVLMICLVSATAAVEAGPRSRNTVRDQKETVEPNAEERVPANPGEGLQHVTEVERLLEVAEKIVQSREGKPTALKNSRLQPELLTDTEQRRLRQATRELQPGSPSETDLRNSGLEQFIHELKELEASPGERKYQQLEREPWQSRGLDGMWLMTLPAGFESPHRMVQVTRNTVWLRSYNNLGGLYLIEDDRLKMLIPVDERMMEHEWKILNANTLLMTASSTDAGADYSGATLTRIVDLENWPTRD